MIRNIIRYEMSFLKMFKYTLFFTFSFSPLLRKALCTLFRLAATCGSGCFDRTSRRFVYNFSVSLIFFSLSIISVDIFKMRFCRICTFLTSSKVLGSVPCYGEKKRLTQVASLHFLFYGNGKGNAFLTSSFRHLCIFNGV